MTELPDSSTPAQIKGILHQALGNLEKFDNCALLDYPNHLNIGDEMIWLGELFYLIDCLKTQIDYVASADSFSAKVMENKVGKAPILLHGGGNLGDLWPKYQSFRHEIISNYHDRPIIILPQSIYFADIDNLKRAANIFNSHPNLTIFARENYSYQIALNYFSNCRVIKSPDMAFQMVGMPVISFTTKSNSNILYQRRQDQELSQSFAPPSIDIENLVVEDWRSYQWIYREKLKNAQVWYWQIPGSVRIMREVWQRGLANPREWISRTLWNKMHPYAAKFDRADQPNLHKKAWELMHCGIYQFNNYKYVITNRLHGHILCLILGKPHVLLPNKYYKNKSFYETWTSSIPFCRFAQNESQIKVAVSEIREFCF
ncbi:MAG: polysaccharide pyruvyl transferase family protein [Coleofasciculus sp. A1-SPW-01]|uniref:polysaccharide pyruvyl transferase family protein n=1 Tax=Coleofasciculus sp. A1-SPW-01 TaxID=3070819 RepID=UPI0032FC8A79